MKSSTPGLLQSYSVLYLYEEIPSISGAESVDLTRGKGKESLQGSCGKVENWALTSSNKEKKFSILTHFCLVPL